MAGSDLQSQMWWLMLMFSAEMFFLNVVSLISSLTNLARKLSVDFWRYETHAGYLKEVKSVVRNIPQKDVIFYRLFFVSYINVVFTWVGRFKKIY